MYFAGAAVFYLLIVMNSQSVINASYSSVVTHSLYLLIIKDTLYRICDINNIRIMKAAYFFITSVS